VRKVRRRTPAQPLVTGIPHTYLIGNVDDREPGDNVRPEKKLGAVTSLPLIVDAHAMTVEWEEDVAPGSTSRPIAHFLTAGPGGRSALEISHSPC